MEFAVEFAFELYGVVVDSAPWLLFGFVAAGVIHLFISDDFVASHLGRGRVLPVIKSALLGVPLPICSCGVVPLAVGLRQRGASKGAALSFMISTPETGIDSILYTSALLDPVMTVMRPVSAFISAVTAGAVETFFGGGEEKRGPAPLNLPTFQGGARTPLGMAAEAIEYGLGSLYYSLAGYLAAGLVIAALISALIPEGFFLQYLGDGFLGRLAMLAVATPMYICATASTPIAAAMILKGLSPGAALVLLLAGPATNVASISALAGMMGWRTTFRYLLTISISALLMGWLVDELYVLLGTSPSAVMGGAAEAIPEWVGVVSALVLILAWLRLLVKRRFG
ncbi:MAG: hypothetical protein C0609_07515 [Deltaproteobacteria bacterium]|nr:MAG: hypothetical protein C0609_07515 [Deltaproteobacteria bacterium]